MNWVLNQQNSVIGNTKSFSFATRKDEFFTFLWAGDGKESEENDEKPQELGNKKVKVVVRNSHGRFGWSFKVFCMVGLERFMRETEEGKADYNKEYLIGRLCQAGDELEGQLRKISIQSAQGRFVQLLESIQGLLVSFRLDQYESHYQNQLDCE